MFFTGIIVRFVHFDDDLYIIEQSSFYFQVELFLACRDLEVWECALTVRFVLPRPLEDVEQSRPPSFALALELDAAILGLLAERRDGL